MKKLNSIEQFKRDYHLFIDIQMGKYLKSCGKNEFNSDKEAQAVISKIIQTWNQKIADEHLRLDSSTKEAKTAWFNSINIKFENKQSD